MTNSNQGKWTGIRPLCDTWPVLGLGGVTGTGKGNGFVQGGFGSAGGMGAMPFGCFDGLPAQLRHQVSGRSFLEGPTAPDAANAGCCRDGDSSTGEGEEPSPRSVTGFDFTAELVTASE